MMNRIITLLTVLSATTASAYANEGMWILSMLSRQNMMTMEQLGCKLTAEQIYSIDKGSLKDAVVIFGGGCTGEIVSERGLVFTNHHCGYSSIQQLSTVEHNYLRNGYWSQSLEEDLPVPDLKIRLLQSFSDVTDLVLKGVDEKMTPQERNAQIEKNKKEITADNKGDEHHQVLVKSFFDNNQYFKIVYDVYTDIRLVGAPPETIGRFGKTTDNWQWPRHTCDFSVFRIYAGPDNAPADYDASNKPYRPRHHLPISLGGIKLGDYAMTIGYPGSTDRYATSMGVKQLMEIDNMSRIEPRAIIQDIWTAEMNADPAAYIMYADKYAKSSNYHKNSIGMNEGIKRHNVVGRKEAEEKEFRQWAKKNADRSTSKVLKKMKKSYAKLYPYNEARAYWNECVYRGCEVLRFAYSVYTLIADHDTMSEADKEELRKKADTFYKDYLPTTDKKVTTAMLKYYSKKIDSKYHPTYLRQALEGKGIDSFVDNLFGSSIITDKTLFYNMLEEGKYGLIKADKACRLGVQMMDVYGRIHRATKEPEQELEELKRIYMAGRMAMNADKSYYSDANFTCRLSYGRVEGYTIDGTDSGYFTDLEGVMAKEDPDNLEFNVDPKLKELHKKRDYGRYADKDGSMHVCFLTNNDITGGNSGSPVIDGSGRLIGLAFDGNWEALSGDIIFETELQRCICVDIRYVLFVIEKIGGAQNIIDELTIKQ